MADLLLLGFILLGIFYGFAPTGFEESDSRIIRDANRVRKGQLRGEDFEPLIHGYATSDLQQWIRQWTYILLVYFAVLIGYFLLVYQYQVFDEFITVLLSRA